MLKIKDKDEDLGVDHALEVEEVTITLVSSHLFNVYPNCYYC